MIAELNVAQKGTAQPLFASEIPITPHDTAERRQVTVMFSDLVGSTALSARMDPEDLREIISAYQKCVAETVRCFDGFVAKYMGDGVLAYFGYPQAHEDDAERAVRAGLALIAAVTGLKTGATLQTRVGIATGLVVVGDLIGSGEAQERAIVGETPNLAARHQPAGWKRFRSATGRERSGLFLGLANKAMLGTNPERPPATLTAESSDGLLPSRLITQRPGATKRLILPHTAKVSSALATRLCLVRVSSPKGVRMPIVPGEMPNRRWSRWKSCCFAATRKSWTPTS
jgi:hypothetical protein